MTGPPFATGFDADIVRIGAPVRDWSAAAARFCPHRRTSALLVRAYDQNRPEICPQQRTGAPLVRSGDQNRP